VTNVTKAVDDLFRKGQNNDELPSNAISSDGDLVMNKTIEMNGKDEQNIDKVSPMVGSAGENVQSKKLKPAGGFLASSIKTEAESEQRKSETTFETLSRRSLPAANASSSRAKTTTDFEETAGNGGDVIKRLAPGGEGETNRRMQSREPSASSGTVHLQIKNWNLRNFNETFDMGL